MLCYYLSCFICIYIYICICFLLIALMCCNAEDTVQSPVFHYYRRNYVFIISQPHNYMSKYLSVDPLHNRHVCAVLHLLLRSSSHFPERVKPPLLLVMRPPASCSFGACNCAFLRSL